MIPICEKDKYWWSWTVAKGNSRPSSCVAAVFHGINGCFLGCFGSFYAAILALDVSMSKGWFHIWLECHTAAIIACFPQSNYWPLCDCYVCRQICVHSLRPESLKNARIFLELTLSPIFKLTLVWLVLILT